MKTLVVAPAPPTQASGTSIVVRRLLENLDPRDIVVLARRPDRRWDLGGAGLPYPVITAPSVPRSWRGERFWRLLACLPGVRAGESAATRHGARIILGMFPDESSLLTAYLLHRRVGLPLVPYFCDLYMEDRTGWQGRLARWLQPRVFRAAARILVVNEGMRDYYRSRYGLDTACLPACINAPIPSFEPPAAPGGCCIIGYSGNVNATRIGSLQALLAAIGEDASYALRYFTPQTTADLQRLGVWRTRSSAEFIKDEQVLVHHLAACDVLFLPLAFETDGDRHDQLTTSFGIKSYEYFLSRKPILLHAPAGSFITRFYRQRGCGLVVDDPSPAALARALDRLREDTALRASLVERALQTAHEFEGRGVAHRLCEILAGVAPAAKGTRG